MSSTIYHISWEKLSDISEELRFWSWR